MLPTASKFTNDVRELDDKARVAVHHTAAAVPVDVIVQRGKKRKKGTLTIEDLANGQQAVAEVRPGRYKVSINVADTNTTVLGPAKVRFKEEVAHFIYAVGTPGSTFQLLTLLIATDDDDDDDDDKDRTKTTMAINRGEACWTRGGPLPRATRDITLR